MQVKNNIRIIADQNIPFLKDALRDFTNVIYLPGKEISKQNIGDAKALITRTRTKISEANLSTNQLEFVATATIGHDHIDKDYCSNNGIVWKNAPGCNARSVAEYVLSVLVNYARLKKFSLKGKTLGIVGLGNVGKEVEHLTEVLGIKILRNDPPRQEKEGKDGFVSLEEIATHADFISFHTPLTKQTKYPTYHLADEAFFHKIKQKAFIINASRGGVVDEQALLNAYDSGLIDAFALDVFEHEPLIDSEIMCKALYVSPHIAGYSIEGKAKGTSMAVSALSKQFDLGLGNWFPDVLPYPKSPVIELKACEDEDTLVYRLVTYAYDVREDDKFLRSKPELFESIRGLYPVRREFSAYSVVLEEGNKNYAKQVEKLGFQIRTKNV